MRILFITSTRIGDAVLSTGALAWAQERWPAAQFTIACGPAAAPIFEATPNVERLIVLRKQGGSSHWRKLWAACAGKWWTAIIDLRRSAMPFLLAARQRYILARSDDHRHKMVLIGEMLGVRERLNPRIWINARHEADADRLMGAGEAPGRPVLALAPTANWGGKEWPIDRFIDMTRELIQPGGVLDDGRVVVFAAPDEAVRAEPLIEALPADRIIDLRGKTELLTAYACLKRADIFIGNDSALMHLSAATGTPTLGLFGPSLDAVYGPWGEKCRVARTDLSFDDIINAPGYDYKSHQTRMETLPVDRVVSAARALWEEHGSTGRRGL